MSRRSASRTVARLLALVPWVAAHPDGVPTAEVCERFGISESQLLADLAVLPYVGVAPFTADTLLDVVIEEGRVWIHPQWFDRPLRLTASQGLALVAAGESLADVQGAEPDGALARALAKVAAALGIEPGKSMDVDLGSGDPNVLRSALQARSAGRQLAIEYYAYGRDERTERVVEPWAVYNAAGAWYVEGWCHLAEDQRLFRVDRIAAAEILEEPFRLPRGAAGDRTFSPAANDPRVTLELAPAAAWVAERFPCEEVMDLGGGHRRVRLAVSGRAWLERLLVQLGGDARLVDAPEELSSAGREAARRMLARYRGGTVAPEHYPSVGE